jgi:hypothetical protein
METCFIDNWQFVSVPEEALLELARQLRSVEAGDKDVHGRQVDTSRADVLADVIEVAVETDAAQLGIDDRDRPAFLWALQTWCKGQGAKPDWATRLGLP